MKSPTDRIGVMHVTDTLSAGGAERVAVNVVNCLPRERYAPYLCTTRGDGPLEDLLEPDVQRLSLKRQGRFDAHALWRLVRFIQTNRIDILHAHQTSLFIAAAAALFPPYPKVIWHDHFGRFKLEVRPAFTYRQATRRIKGVIAVNPDLADWSRRSLHVPAERVWYVPNFACAPEPGGAPPELPGAAGGRIVCVANFRRQKDHLTLVRAMARVADESPAAHLLLVGVLVDHSYVAEIQAEIAARGLAGRVTLLGERRDVGALLRACDVGVLSSSSEGLPLALVEYGLAGLPAVATDVGQCAEVLAEGRAGLLVPPGDPAVLAEALLTLLRSPERR
ncbi:MAG: glycosyltransferase, partial [Pyrinomonadaceae bacterium]